MNQTAMDNVVCATNKSASYFNGMLESKMLKNVAGVIINTSSVTAYDGTNGQAGQAASNAAIIGMTLPIAREFKDVGIRVVTIAPGLFNTPLLLGTMPAETKQFLAETVVFPQRFGKPEEYAEMVQIVIETPMLNGTTIRLDGGYRGFLL